MRLQKNELGDVQMSDFDKYLLVPQYSELHSRNDVDLKKDFLGLGKRLPFILSPMSTVSSELTCELIYNYGGIGVVHRYMTIDEQADIIARLHIKGVKVGASIGTTNMKIRIEECYKAMADFFIIDVAHAHTKDCLDMVKYIKESFDIPVISGNIVTKDAADDFIEAGIDAFRVGMGSGSVCTTREVCGVGRNQLDAIHDIHYRYPEIPVYSCGGIRNSGDIVKALAFGASGVIIGRLFAMSNEAPNVGVHYGMASINAENDRPDLELETGVHHLIAPEGTSEILENQEPLKDIVTRLEYGTKAGLAYIGAKDIEDLWTKADWEYQGEHYGF